MNRRGFLAATAAGASVGAAGLLLRGSTEPAARLRKLRAEHIPGSIVGAHSKLGHRLREGGFGEPTDSTKQSVVIVGGGISGLSAAWWLKRNGFRDFQLLELEEEVGGNSRFDRNSVSAYPWGAHYVPLPNPDATHVLALFEELGVIRGYDPAGIPIYDETYLCLAPQERLFIHGEWQEGLHPTRGATQADLDQSAAFLAEVERLRHARGRDGRLAFTIPLELSSRDPELLALDRISISDYLKTRGWVSKRLAWYVNYCCRDDFGCSAQDTSAWAAFHYFSSRRGKASGVPGHPVLTWPEGNGWIVSRLREKLKDHIHPQSLAYRVDQEGRSTQLDYWDAQQNRARRIEAQHVILATPRFIAQRLMQGVSSTEFTYAPWMVANITVDSPPQSLTDRGAPLSWDNVIYSSPSLGYVVATHQDLKMHTGATVLTYYSPLSSGDPTAERTRAYHRSYSDWRQEILQDLSVPHPTLADQVRHLDVWLWGHGMIRPKPGFIWGEARSRALKNIGHVHFAHSDLSGISIFEEAQFQGVRAARDVLKALGSRAGTPA